MNPAQERWRPAPGFEGFYEVSDFGRVRTLRKRKGDVIKLRKSTKGYLYVRLSKHGVVLYPRVHRLVALAFIPEVPGKPMVDHIDSCVTNNHWSNLQWVTNAENGRKGRRATLSLEWARVIRDHQARGIVKDTELACLAGVTATTIYAIRHDRLWVAR